MPLLRADRDVDGNERGPSLMRQGDSQLLGGHPYAGGRPGAAGVRDPQQRLRGLPRLEPDLLRPDRGSWIAALPARRPGLAARWYGRGLAVTKAETSGYPNSCTPGARRW